MARRITEAEHERERTLKDEADLLQQRLEYLYQRAADDSPRLAQHLRLCGRAEIRFMRRLRRARRPFVVVHADGTETKHHPRHMAV